MSKITLNNLSSLTNENTALTTINGNNSIIQSAFDNTLSLDGTQPNTMAANLDMNSNRILNLPAPSTNQEPLRLGDIVTTMPGVITFSGISGQVLPSQLPNPTSSTLGGTRSAAAVSHQWIDSISTSGIPHQSQPAFSDISGTVSVGQLPAVALSSVVAYSTKALAAAATIASSTEFVITQGYFSINDGGNGVYSKLSAPPGSVRNWHFQSADGAWWQLQVPTIYPRQVGAVLDGVADDTTAIQAWVDYAATFGVIARDQAGTALVPTSTITLSSNTRIEGSNIMTIKKQSDVVGELILGTSVNNVRVAGINLTTTSSFTSTSSNTIGNTTQNYTVPAGLVGLVVNNFVQITSISSPLNYMIARINSYSGTTLNVTGTTSVGSGTFTNWVIDSYPLNGNLASTNSGMKFVSSTNIYIERNNLTGRFYDGIDCRNTNHIYINNNTVTGHVNRGIIAGSYTFGMTDCVISNNTVDGSYNGNSNSQYGILTSATSSGAFSELRIYGNKVFNTNFQGISMGGAISNSSIIGNTIKQTTTWANNILVDLADSLTPQYIVVSGNNTYLGAYGVVVVNGLYTNITGNVIVSPGTNGILLSGSTGGSIVYTTVNSNIVSFAGSHGINLQGSVANAIVGVSINGNSVNSSTGWGFNSNSSANVTSVVLCGNVSQSNSSGSYNIGGSSAPSGGNI